MTETPGKKLTDFPDYHASRPGPLTFAAVIAVIGLYVAVAHGDQVKALFGF